jgi:hypothetical protein
MDHDGSPDKSVRQAERRFGQGRRPLRRPGLALVGTTVVSGSRAGEIMH